ncbi:hypothetical protein AKJ40_04740 [candidate division MSBL1 archaeon SCGC-AAA259M10]|uniref:Calcineurin-like phosphoesterase domain-containing protein n=2 Tax=candidate division MSBL1 TaxID=215777 RepID=A0A133V5T8_9EURY|nr:hypothetical protein AKJ40_04740 [candidate division MSBL1 archaeon SCGC-AAA259M10]KXB01803.1 hypothetical protein AKJ41_00040 [candidate division MSBL1 archaeon SCGC-AAA259O05]
MNIFDFEIVNSYPALWNEESGSVVVSDLHLGLEGLLAEEGTYFPKFQLEGVKEDLGNIFAHEEASRLIIVGDLKHEFSKASYFERKEIEEFLNFLEDLVGNIIILKGNHDNYLMYSVEGRENVALEDIYIDNRICYFHGHQDDLGLERTDAEIFVMGHEHPAIVLRDEVGVEEKFRVFLHGELEGGRKIIVMPAFSKLASGNRVNGVPKTELLSPFLKRHADLGRMKPVAVHEDSEPLGFPKLSDLEEFL